MNYPNQTLISLKNQIVNCILCDLSKNRINAVPGTGNIHDKIILVGEAPGKNEDERGVPFVGSAGKILDKALTESGLNREDVYITNIVKCRPPNNRVPTEVEIDICINAYLKNEIKLISPKIICIMGATALKSLLGLEHLNKHRGKVLQISSNKYFVTYHPAATIYNIKLKEVFFKDIQKLAQIVKEDTSTLKDYL